ncbi:transcriptional regulator, partial [Corallococcus exercitus]|nr:transcriptional regulator [Corallococcus exercitus]
VDYSLTPLGEEVAVHVEALTTWIEDNLPRVMTARTKAPARKKAS